MSYDIKMRAILKSRVTGVERELTVDFNMPYPGNTVDLDFDGFVMVEAVNDGGMKLTGRAVDGRGTPYSIEECGITFKELT